MIARIKDIAEVSTGVTFRSQIESSESGKTRVIQMKDLGEEIVVNSQNLVRIELKKIKASQIVQKFDVLFRSRGNVNTAVLVQEDLQDAVVLSAPLIKVRPDLRRVAPEFLVWWINQLSSQRYFASSSRGTLVKMVSKQVLENLEVTLPALGQQKKIAEYYKLSKQEQSILSAQKNLKLQYTQGILMQKVIEDIESNQ